MYLHVSWTEYNVYSKESLSCISLVNYYVNVAFLIKVAVKGDSEVLCSHIKYRGADRQRLVVLLLVW